MSMDISLRDSATPALKALLLRLSGRRAHAVLGQAVRVRVREHLRDKEAQPNKQGWPKTHFYGRARERTTFTATETSATVTVALEGFRQRFHGGPIRPVNAKSLAIPAHPDAYGKGPREFGDSLRFEALFRRQMIGQLVGRPGTPFAGQVMYRLVRSVLQGADPTVIPTPREMLRAATVALANAVQRAA